ncbi:MAG: T9SS type A sorting domain-containing protein [Flavobacteriia bacterium]|nr:T9SS type A sorting domain-containing protein [Flavobacteriia bacterium]
MKTRGFIFSFLMICVVKSNLNAQCQCKFAHTCFEQSCTFLNQTLCTLFGGDWYVGLNCDVLLPIELKEFYIEKIDDNISINWTTESERENKQFIIETSIEGYFWETLVTIPGAINSIEQKKYSFFDNLPKIGSIIYYRLLQEDIDGRVQIVAKESIEIENSELLIYPNPAKNEMFIQFPKLYSENSIEIYSTEGKMIYELKEIEDSVIKIDIFSFENGVYNLKFTNKGISRFFKFVIQRK